MGPAGARPGLHVDPDNLATPREGEVAGEEVRT